jgi:hypothetical protein
MENDGLDNFTIGELVMIRDTFALKAGSSKSFVFRDTYAQIADKCAAQLRELGADEDTR